LIALPGLFVVGTDTGVGKTRVASAIARGLVREGRRPGVLKPLATGVGEDPGRGDDAARLIAAVGGSIPPERVAPIVFAEPLAPAVAARRLGGRLEQDEIDRAVNEALAWWSDRADVMVVEGIGGLLTPLAEGTTVADLAIRLDYPLVVVARRGLGTLNQTLLTLEAARHRGLRLAGVVLNGAEPTREDGSLAEATNAGELARRLDSVAVLAEVPHDEGPEVMDALLGRIGWAGRALAPRYWPTATHDPGAADVILREPPDAPGASSEELSQR
jgi:dethiobiotin synthetase